MYTITNNVKNELIIKNSKFICTLYKVNSKEEINKYLKEIKTIYKDATHYCTAYIFENEKKADDDKEPPKTAGIPILNVLEKNNLNNVLCIVIRYFGGVKLGTGGLIRAYTKSVVEALKKTTYKKLIPGYEVIIQFPYNKAKQIDHILNKNYIITKDFKDKIIYHLQIPSDLLTTIKQLKNIDIQIQNQINIENDE